VIRNAVIHLANEQPLLADLFAPPSGADVSLVCTNLRTLNGKRPVFADAADSLFVSPYAHTRFVEISSAALAAAGPVLTHGGAVANGHADGHAAAALVAALAPERAGNASAGDTGDAGDRPTATADGVAEAEEPDAEAAGPSDDLEVELEIDEDFLRRVREV
jgi:hypothetical protein